MLKILLFREESSSAGAGNNKGQMDRIWSAAYNCLLFWITKDGRLDKLKLAKTLDIICIPSFIKYLSNYGDVSHRHLIRMLINCLYYSPPPSSSSSPSVPSLPPPEHLNPQTLKKIGLSHSLTSLFSSSILFLPPLFLSSFLSFFLYSFCPSLPSFPLHPLPFLPFHLSLLAALCFLLIEGNILLSPFAITSVHSNEIISALVVIFLSFLLLSLLYAFCSQLHRSLSHAPSPLCLSFLIPVFIFLPSPFPSSFPFPFPSLSFPFPFHMFFD